MKHLNLTRYIWAIAGTLFAIFVLFLVFQPPPENSFINLVKILSSSVGIETILIGVFVKFLWKFRFLQDWFVPFPNLNGTYQGTIQTTWIDTITGERPAPIPAILTIKQSFTHISCVMRTEEMTSFSFISDFILDENNQLKQLSYSYNSQPKQIVIERSPQHYGTIVFDIIEEEKIKLIGYYWTGRKTTGNIEMEFYADDKLDYFPKEFGKHPVSEVRDYKS